MKPTISLFLILAVFNVQAVETPAPSSEIPARREFPLNEKINPCDNFHAYVCSKAEAAFKLRDDRNRHTFSFNDSAERILEAKKTFFKNIALEKKLTPRSLQIKNYYLACMDEKNGARNEKVEIAKLKALVDRIQTPQQFADLQINRLLKSESSVVSFGVGSNQDNPNVNDIQVVASFMNLPEYSYYDNKELMADYRQLVIDFFKLVEPQTDVASIEARADRMLKLEKGYVDVYPHPEVERQRWTEKRQEKQADFINKYSAARLAPFFKKIPAQTLVLNAIPESLEFYNQSLTTENLTALKDFYLYSHGKDIFDDSNPEFFKKKFDFNAKYMGGPIARADRQERCTKNTMYTFTKELDQLLVKKIFPDFPADKFKAVASRIRESIIKGLTQNTWLETSSKNKAILKIQKAKLYLIQPENPRQWDFVDVRKYSTTDRFANGVQYKQAWDAKILKTLKTGANLEAWDMGPLTVTAYYDPSANKFVMPIGILQYPFFNPDGDLIENLGAVGAVIGHELGHGVDDQGSKYDENGKLSQWMSMKDLKEFSMRGKRLIDQFNKAGHNGSLTLGENIGDLVGLTFAYRAAFPEGSAKPEDQRKLFISYGRLWCGVARPKAEEQLLKTDPHALGRARINEQVKHQKAFAEAFNCKSSDKMSLPDDQRVTIW